MLVPRKCFLVASKKRTAVRDTHCVRERNGSCRIVDSVADGSFAEQTSKEELGPSGDEEQCITESAAVGSFTVQTTKEELGPDGEDEKYGFEELNAELESLLKFQEVRGGKVEKVAASDRESSDSPCVITTSEYGRFVDMERVMKAAHWFLRGVQEQSSLWRCSPRQLLKSCGSPSSIFEESLTPRGAVASFFGRNFDARYIGEGFQELQPEATFVVGGLANLESVPEVAHIAGAKNMRYHVRPKVIAEFETLASRSESERIVQVPVPWWLCE